MPRTSKAKTIPITKARVNLGAVVEKVRTTGESIILEKGGIPVATLTSAEALEDMRDALDLMVAREKNRQTPLLDWDSIRARHA